MTESLGAGQRRTPSYYTVFNTPAELMTSEPSGNIAVTLYLNDGVTLNATLWMRVGGAWVALSSVDPSLLGAGVGSVDGVSPNVPGGNVDLVAGTGIALTPDNTTDAITIASTVVTSPWADITTFLNSWVSFSTATVPRYSRIGEVVFVEGVVKKSTAPAAFETIFTLPEGFRPGKVIAEPVNASNAFGLMQVLETGEVRYVSGTASTTFYTFISFRRA